MRWILSVTLLLAALPVKSQERPASPLLMTMGPMDAESDQKSTAITVRYDSKPGFDKPKIEAMGSFLQISLPNTLVPQPGQFVDAKSPYIRKFAAFQLDPQTAALRLFVSKDAAQLAPALSVDILENRVLIILDHIQAEKSLQPVIETVQPKPQEALAPVASPSPDIPKNQVPSTKSIVSEENVNEKKQTSGSIEEMARPNVDDGMKEKLVIVTVFLAVMLLLLIGLKTWRRLMTKKWPLSPTEGITVKTLATHPLGPKQKLTVVQVGQEQILLGVSPDQINFLSSLNKREDIPVRSSYEMQPMPRNPSVAPPKREALAEPVSSKSASRRTGTPQEPARSGSSISYGIGDDGIKNLKNSRPVQADQDSIEDVTKLIRKKLRDLPKV